MEARAQKSAGTITADALREVENAAIRDVIAMQHEVGLQSATDGEFRRAAWHMDFIYQLGGVTQADEKLHVQFFNDGGTLDFAPAALRINERIRLGETIFADHFRYLKDNVSGGVTPKLTIPSPSMVHYRGGRAAIDQAVYPDMDRFWNDLTAAYAEEVRRLGDLGCTYLQLDDTSLAYLNDPRQRELIASLGGDREHQHELYIRNINSVLAAKPPGMRITTHMCRGNFRSSWAAEGGYDFVAEALFGELGVDGFFLEYDDARSGGFEPLRYVPNDKYVVLGLVTTKRGSLETKDDLKRRIEAAAKFVPLERLCRSLGVVRLKRKAVRSSDAPECRASARHCGGASPSESRATR
jgi:5-methyltetrahydropteroyltriglutamate--homocysteine methyltransferase